MLIGITGGIGSGKTTVAKMFADFDKVAIYFADIEAKKLMNSSERIKSQLIDEFSEEVYKNGALNRAYLAGIVFKDKEKLEKLNAIVHPVVYQHLQDFVKSNDDKDYIVYENAILFENGSEKLCDKIITVTAPEEIRVERVVKRDQTTEKEVRNRIKNQWSDEKKTLQSHYVIHNLSVTSVVKEVRRIHNNLTKR